MIYKVLEEEQKRLLSIPETGMGYQTIKAKPISELYEKKYIVYNAELIIPYDKQFEEYKHKLKTVGFQNLIKEAERIELDKSSIVLIDRREITQYVSLTESEITKKRHLDGKGASENDEELANGKEMFVRLSAYKDDKRIDFVNKKLLPGTYTTTHLDYLDCIDNFDDPIDRYALPNNEPIKWAFFVLPKKLVDTLQRGIVQPAFGHKGGGLEAYFRKGTSENTYKEVKVYGK